MITLVRGVIARSMASAVMRKFSASSVGRVDHFAARVLNDVLERDPVGHRQNDLVAVVHQHLDGVEQSQLAASGEDCLFGRVVRAEIAGVALTMALRSSGMPATTV